MCRLLHDDRARHCICRAAERDHQAVTQALDLFAASRRDHVAEETEMHEQLIDRHVAEARGQLRRPDEVGKHNRDRVRPHHLTPCWA
jgi:hypothetical protein